MKSNKSLSLVLTVVCATFAALAARAADAPPTNATPADTATPAVAPAVTKPATDSVPAVAAPMGKDGLRLNFRGVPLEMVLNYLSEAAGFTIIQEANVRGQVDVFSSQPLNKDEAVELLNTILKTKGYAAIRNGRTLTIVSQEDAKKEHVPVEQGRDPELIPKTDDMVTQIIPVKYANATQMVKDLSPLLPGYAQLSANESANALVLTDTKANVHRMVEIVKALDTSISNVSSIRVFPLRFADAKDLAAAIKDLFAPATPTTGNGAGGGRNAFNRFGFGGGGFPGFGGPGGFGGRGGGGGGGAAGDAGAGANTRVVAVIDERTNSLIVSAPEDYMPAIENLVKSVDVVVSDITELRVFHLQNADPVEMADLFSSIFPDDTKSGDTSNQAGFRFAGGRFGGPGGFFGGGNRGAQAATDSSDRMKKKGRVLAVADQRTSSLVVSAASELMPQIAEMIARLDESPAKRQKVFVYSLENADPQEVQSVLSDMFQKTTTSSSRNSANQQSALQKRILQSTQNGGSSGGGFGSGGVGGGSGGLSRGQ